MEVTYDLEICGGSNDEDEDDWENAIIPDLLQKKEIERKLIEERKKVEEADNILAEELFSDKKIEYNVVNKPIILEKKEKPKSLENRREKLIENQKEKSELIKKRKMEQQRLKEIYGDTELDEYDELYGSIQDKY